MLCSHPSQRVGIVRVQWAETGRVGGEEGGQSNRALLRELLGVVAGLDEQCVGSCILTAAKRGIG